MCRVWGCRVDSPTLLTLASSHYPTILKNNSYNDSQKVRVLYFVRNKSFRHSRIYISSIIHTYLLGKPLVSAVLLALAHPAPLPIQPGGAINNGANRWNTLAANANTTLAEITLQLTRAILAYIRRQHLADHSVETIICQKLLQPEEYLLLALLVQQGKLLQDSLNVGSRCFTGKRRCHSCSGCRKILHCSKVQISFGFLDHFLPDVVCHLQSKRNTRAWGNAATF